MALVDGIFITAAELIEMMGGDQSIGETSGNDEKREQSALERAESDVKTMLSSTFVLPASPAETPFQIKSLVGSAFKYHLASGPIDSVASDEIRFGYDEFRKLIEDLRRGKSDIAELQRISELHVTNARGVRPPVHRRPTQRGRIEGMRPRIDQFIDPFEEVPGDPEAWPNF
jgi:phage gp36-like protein